MIISISITPEEATALATNLNIDPAKLLDSLSMFNSIEPAIPEGNIPNNYSREMLNDWFEKISWQTFYFSHLIIVHAKQLKQYDSYGYYLDSSQLFKLGGISERSAASRVGGSRRVCKAINSIDILFIRSQSKERRKLFYVNSDAIDDLHRIVNESDKDYREELDSLGLDYPSTINE